MDLEDLEARVVQHENDHIDGVLFIDRMTEAARRELDPRMADFEAQFRRQQASGAIPPDDVLERTLRRPRAGWRANCVGVLTGGGAGGWPIDSASVRLGELDRGVRP